MAIKGLDEASGSVPNHWLLNDKTREASFHACPVSVLFPKHLMLVIVRVRTKE